MCGACMYPRVLVWVCEQCMYKWHKSDRFASFVYICCIYRIMQQAHVCLRMDGILNMCTSLGALLFTRCIVLYYIYVYLRSSHVPKRLSTYLHQQSFVRQTHRELSITFIFSYAVAGCVGCQSVHRRYMCASKCAGHPNQSAAAGPALAANVKFFVLNISFFSALVAAPTVATDSRENGEKKAKQNLLCAKSMLALAG